MYAYTHMYMCMYAHMCMHVYVYVCVKTHQNRHIECIHFVTCKLYIKMVVKKKKKLHKELNV